MKIVCLDQCAISGLVKFSEKDKFWRDLLGLLRSGAKTGCLICPLPLETIVETIPCNSELRLNIRNLQQELSGGIEFKSYSEIVGEETLSLVRPSFEPIAYKKFVWSRVEDDALAKRQLEIWNTGKRTAEEMNAAFVDPPERKSLSVGEIHREILLEQVRSLYRHVEHLILEKKLDPKNDLSLEICQILLREKITINEPVPRPQNLFTFCV